MRQRHHTFALDSSNILSQAQNYLATNRLHTPPLSARPMDEKKSVPQTAREARTRLSRDHTPTTQRQAKIAIAIEQHNQSQARIEDSIL